MGRGLGFAQKAEPRPGPGYETPEQFRARKMREVEQQERERRAREDELRRQRGQDPYGGVTMDQRGNPQWRDGRPGVGARIIDETVRELDDVPGPHRMITGPYRQYSDSVQGGGPPMPQTGGRGARGGRVRQGEGGSQYPSAKTRNNQDNLPDTAGAEDRRRAQAYRWQKEREEAARLRQEQRSGKNEPGRRGEMTRAMRERDSLHQQLLRLRKEYDSASPKRREVIMDQINGIGRKINDIDRYLRGPY